MVVRRSLRVAADAPAQASPAPGRCPLCDRPLPAGPTVDRHHPRPRSMGGTATVPMHRICHRMLHATFTERELAELGDDWTALRARPEIAGFVRWVARRPPEFHDRSRTARRLRD